MIFYHGTSLENWNKIQKEGVLFGRIPNPNKEYNPSRCTYLATDFNEAKYYGDIVLEVEYNPLLHPKMNNYIEGCWQLRVYEPIQLKYIHYSDSNKLAKCLSKKILAYIKAKKITIENALF